VAPCWVEASEWSLVSYPDRKASAEDFRRKPSLFMPISIGSSRLSRHAASPGLSVG
jgi:hypothetical protein